MEVACGLNAHQKPPDALRLVFKRYQKASQDDLDHDCDLLNPGNASGDTSLRYIGCISSLIRSQAFKEIGCRETSAETETPVEDASIYEVKALPGLLVIPSLLSLSAQINLLERLCHRDLSNDSHKTNLHLHYHVPYSAADDVDGKQQSFFSYDQNTTFLPKDPFIHKPLLLKQVLARKLRWVTFGGQYDWTTKEYPDETPPAFPQDIARMLRTLLPDIDPQAAILNFYSPGDTLSVHRDVSEECDVGLVSISMGCEGIFVIGNEDGSQTITMKLRSGDAVIMSGASRFAWHAVPKIIANSCPEWLQEWPADVHTQNTYQAWKSWMSSKRLNLNVRQMQKSDTDSVQLCTD